MPPESFPYPTLVGEDVAAETQIDPMDRRIFSAPPLASSDLTSGGDSGIFIMDSFPSFPGQEADSRFNIS